MATLHVSERTDTSSWSSLAQQTGPGGGPRECQASMPGNISWYLHLPSSTILPAPFYTSTLEVYCIHGALEAV